MRKDHSWRTIRPWLSFGSIALGLYAIALGVGRTGEVSSWFEFLQWYPKWARGVPAIWIPLATGMSGALSFLNKKIAPAWLWRSVHALLSTLQNDLFREEMARGEPVHHHRVTLFKWHRYGPLLSRHTWNPRRGWWRSGWLIPVERSHHTTRQSATAFWVPDSADGAEGVAGQAWVASAIIYKSDLPDVSGAASDEEIRTYAHDTWTSPSWVSSRRPHARSFVGVPVLVRGRPWGAVVIDSAERRKRNMVEEKRLYALAQAFFGNLLEQE